MSITNKLNQIKNAIYGKEVRGAIHDAIKQVYDDASVNHDNANMEVKLARGTHDTLNDRLDNVDEIQAQTNAQLSQTNALLGDDGTLQINSRDLFHSAKEVWLNVKDYGAKGDGITDDTEAIKLALSKGDNLYFPVGVYVISEKIDLNKSTCMKGSTCMRTWGSPAKTILKGIHNDFIFECFWNNANNFERLTFEGKGIKMPCCSHIVECEFTGVLGIELLRVSVVERCSFHNCSEAGIKTATDSRISSNFFYNNEIGIYMYNSNDNIISNNKIEWNGVGIQLDTNTYNLIQGNIFDRNTTFGIDAKNGSQLSIKNNQFERNLIHHIRISSKIFNIIGNSFFHKNTEDDMSGEMLPIEAIQLKSTQQGLITANTVQGEKMFSTSHDFFSDNTIQGNLINGVSDSPKWVNIGSVTVPNAQTKTLRYEWSNLDYLKANGYDVLIRSVRVTNGDNIYYNATVTQHKNNGIYVDVTNNTGSDKTFDVFVLLEHLQWNKR